MMANVMSILERKKSPRLMMSCGENVREEQVETMVCGEAEADEGGDAHGGGG